MSSPASLAIMVFSAALPRVADQPAHGQRLAPLRADLDRHLVGGAADPPGLHLDHRLDVLDRLLEDRQRVFLRLFLEIVQRAVDDVLGDALLAVAASCVDHLGDEHVAVHGIGRTTRLETKPLRAYDDLLGELPRNETTATKVPASRLAERYRTVFSLPGRRAGDWQVPLR